MARLITLTDAVGNERLFNPDHIVDVVYVEGLGHTMVYIDVKIDGANYVKVKALDMDMNEQIYKGEGLLARAFCHELDHLDGKMYTRLVEGELHHVSYDNEEEEE